MTKLIAEIGWNHMGDMKLAEEMIIAAKESGCDYAKFQTWSVDHLKPGPWDDDGRREIYEKAELSKDDHYFLAGKCKENDISFLTSCFNINDIDFISSLSTHVKIPGVESRNQKLVNAALDNFKHVYLSTGTSSLLELDYIKHKQNMTLMHCVSVYPCPAELVNMRRMRFMKSYYNVPVGYSGHYEGTWDAFAAAYEGATVIEKHFTTDRSLPGRDNKFALLPEDFKQIRDFVDEIPKMYSLNTFDYLRQEEGGRDMYTGRWSG